MYFAVGVHMYNFTKYFNTLLGGVRTSHLHQSVRHAPFYVLKRSVIRTASVRRAADIQSYPCLYTHGPCSSIREFSTLNGCTHIKY